MESGIYKITCLINNRYYIGSAKNINKRWNRHLNDLRNKKHVNQHLQRTFDKYGEEQFIFEILENCNVNELLLKEQLYLDTLKPYIDGFNIGTCASGGDNLSHHPEKEIIVEKITKSIKKRFSNMSQEERMLKFGKFGEKNPNYGNKWTDEMRLKASEINKEKFKNGLNPFCDRVKGITNKELFGDEKAKEISKKLSEHASSRTGEKNPFYGKNHSFETKEKLSKSRSGIKPSNRVKISINGVIYESYNDASKYLGLPVTTIRWRCLSDSPKYIEYFLIS
jgi:group I intron endonuclease